MIDALALTAALTLAGPTVEPAEPTRRQVVAAARRFPVRWKPFAACVIRRESHGNPRAVNGSSGAAGIAQWMPAWRHGLPFALYRRLRAVGMDHAQATRTRKSMPHLIQRWPEWAQRAAMVQVLVEGGAAHWRLSGSPCEAYR